jgi:2-keto-3-deoxy-L-fuconate dehydrogenase
MGDRLIGKRVLVTSCDTYMGPPIVELFREQGADVIADASALIGATEPADVLDRAGDIDVLVANLDLAAYAARVRDIDDGQWMAGFDAMLDCCTDLVVAIATHASASNKLRHRTSSPERVRPICGP